MLKQKVNNIPILAKEPILTHLDINPNWNIESGVRNKFIRTLSSGLNPLLMISRDSGREIPVLTTEVIKKKIDILLKFFEKIIPLAYNY